MLWVLHICGIASSGGVGYCLAIVLPLPRNNYHQITWHHTVHVLFTMLGLLLGTYICEVNYVALSSAVRVATLITVLQRLYVHMDLSSCNIQVARGWTVAVHAVMWGLHYMLYVPRYRVVVGTATWSWLLIAIGAIMSGLMHRSVLLVTMVWWTVYWERVYSM